MPNSLPTRRTGKRERAQTRRAVCASLRSSDEPRLSPSSEPWPACWPPMPPRSPAGRFTHRPASASNRSAPAQRSLPPSFPPAPASGAQAQEKARSAEPTHDPTTPDHVKQGRHENRLRTLRKITTSETHSLKRTRRMLSATRKNSSRKTRASAKGARSWSQRCERDRRVFTPRRNEQENETIARAPPSSQGSGRQMSLEPQGQAYAQRRQASSPQRRRAESGATCRARRYRRAGFRLARMGRHHQR